jgi:metal-sulfur cluster biosynthetic enzyme
VIGTAPVVSEAAVLSALSEVSDPELDESIVALGFIDSVRVAGSQAELVLRLPTFWCAPNFAYLMAHDARQAVLALGGIDHVDVRLKDHMYSDEISTGVSDGQPFDQVFEGQCEDDDLDELREAFRRKALGMRQEQLVRFLLDAGVQPAQIVALEGSDVLDTSDSGGLRLRIGGRERLLRGGAPLARAYLARRARAGLTGRLITGLGGEPLQDLSAHLDHMRRQRISMTFNALMCRGLLETRYGLSRREEG